MDTLVRCKDTAVSQKGCSIFENFRKIFLKTKKILAAHWLEASIESSQKCIHLGPLPEVPCVTQSMIYLGSIFGVALI